MNQPPSEKDGAEPPLVGKSNRARELAETRQKVVRSALRRPVLQRAIGIGAVYRVSGGPIIASGLAYATLLALVPMLALVIAGLSLVADDETRSTAIDVLVTAFPAISALAPAVEGAAQHAVIGSVGALIGTAWAASGLYFYLTRAMEQFFPGKPVSGLMARATGVILVVLVIIGLLAAVVVSGILSVVASALAFDAAWLVPVIGASLTLAAASGITYAVYRTVPSAPPPAASALLPAFLAGTCIGLLTLFYGLLSPWLASAFEAFGVVASVFVALVWLRLVFMMVTFGAAMARYQEEVLIARLAGAADPAAAATERLVRVQQARAAMGMAQSRATAAASPHRHRAHSGSAGQADRP